MPAPSASTPAAAGHPARSEERQALPSDIPAMSPAMAAELLRRAGWTVGAHALEPVRRHKRPAQDDG